MKVVVSKLIPRLDKLYSSAQQYTHLINKLLCLFKNRIKIFFSIYAYCSFQRLLVVRT